MKLIAVWIGLAVIALFSQVVAAETVAPVIGQPTIDSVTKTLIEKYGETNRFRIERGVQQVARFWMEDDGSAEVFDEFCNSNFIASPETLDAYFKRWEMNWEIIDGYFNEMSLDLKQPIDLDWGELLPVDDMVGGYNPAAHLQDDFYANKIAFGILLNFPYYSLEEKMAKGEKWTRKEWAYARLGDKYVSRIPARVSMDITKITTEAESYISDYNIFVGQLVDKNMKTFFPKEMKLLTHWNLRDELKSRYKDTAGLFKQQMIYRVMERIVSQDIPTVVINNPKYQWDPFANAVYENGKQIKSEREPDTRYSHLLEVFKARKKADPYYPYLPTHVKRMFDDSREIPEAEVEALFKELISSKEVEKVSQVIRKRLKRDLQPFDIWYDGFSSNSSISEEELNKIVAAKYPTAKAFEDDIYNIMVKLGFSEETARFVAPKIRVDPARGSGHCAGTDLKSARVRLRTRVGANGMDYKGYNIAVHELGHAVESVLTLQKMDYFMLRSVPNVGFTEAFAFVFQDRAIQLLGLKQENPQDRYLKALDIFWNAYEIMGVSLLDMKVWNWMYNHPDATPQDLKAVTLSISKEIWNQYYAPVFKIKDQTILAIYSHMIDSALYLPDYPLGHLIQFQVERYMEGKIVGKEMERMCASGRIIPQLWMRNAVGDKISAKPILEAVNEAILKVK